MIPSATDVAALQSRLDAAEKENADLESALDEKNSQLSDYEYCRNEIAKARAELEDHKRVYGGCPEALLLLRLRFDELKQRCAKLEGALHEAETAMAEGDDYLSILDEADKRAKECEAEGDMFGWNFFKGQRSGTVNRSISQQATVRSIRAALAPDSGADCGTAEPAMLKELRAHVSTLTITSENIGDIRRSLFMPFDCDWNGWVRGLTAERENKDCGTKEEGETR